tara:strand:- start:734 stop:1051 length:318 start_codon:yes stop_codon:yes gene_type:complete
MFIFCCRHFLDPFTDHWIRTLECEKNTLKDTQNKLERRVLILEIRNSFLRDRINARYPWQIEEENASDEPMEDINPDSLWQPWLFSDFDDPQDTHRSWISNLFAL